MIQKIFKQETPVRNEKLTLPKMLTTNSNALQTSAARLTPPALLFATSCPISPSGFIGVGKLLLKRRPPPGVTTSTLDPSFDVPLLGCSSFLCGGRRRANPPPPPPRPLLSCNTGFCHFE